MDGVLDAIPFERSFEFNILVCPIDHKREAGEVIPHELRLGWPAKAWLAAWQNAQALGFRPYRTERSRTVVTMATCEDRERAQS